MNKRLSIALVLALTGCLVLAENNTVTKNTVGKGYSSPYGQNDNTYGRNYGKQRSPYGSPQQYGNGAPPYNGGVDYNNNNYGPQNNNGYNNNGYGNNYNVPQHYDAYGSGPNTYGHDNQQQQQYPSNYPENGPFYFNNKHHYYDTHYCSVHGSFSLAYSTEENYIKPEANSQSGDQSGYGNQNSGYGENSGYGNGYVNHQTKHKTRYYTRQYCRYSAASSDKACNFCCRVVARSSNTSPDDIVSAIFAFDPINPTNNGAGFEVDEYSGEQTSEKSTNYNNYKSSSIFQCVCCAPKHSYK